MSDSNNQNAGRKRPNFLLIVADDLGFSDVGACDYVEETGVFLGPATVFEIAAE